MKTGGNFMKKAWFMSILVFLAAITCSLAFMKAPPTMVLIMQAFDAGLAVIGLVMTIPTVMTIAMPLPFGAVVEKIGPKRAMLVTLGCALIGNSLGAISTSFSMLLFARVFDGAAFSGAMICLPKVIAMWFPPQKRGLPMGVLFAMFVPMGLLIAAKIASPIAASFTWRGIWWFCAILNIIAIILMLFFKEPSEGEGAVKVASSVDPVKKTSLLSSYKSPLVWGVGIAFFLKTMLSSSFTNFYSTYLVKSAGYDLATANRTYSYAIIGMIIGGVFAGAILNKVNKKYHAILLIASFVLMAIPVFYEYHLTGPLTLLVPFCLFSGFIYTIPLPIVFTIAPNVANRPEDIGPIMGIVNFGNGIGGLISSLIIGPLVIVIGGWSGLSTPLLAILALPLIVSLILQKAYAKKIKTVD